MNTFAHLDKKQHGTPEFPAEYYYVDSQHPRYQMPFHWHREWEILRVLDGSFLIHLDNEQYRAGPGDILLIRGGTLHGGMPSACVYECLDFDLHGIFRGMDMVKPYLRPFYRQTVIPQSRFPAGADREVEELVAALMEAFRGGSCCRELDAVACLSGLFAWICRQGRYTTAPADGGDVSRVDRIKSVLEFIEGNYGAGLSLETLAAVVGMNPKYFCRVFRSLTHQSPMDYVNFYRIERAAHLLESTDRSITAVGSECGFTESSYFTKVFKKYKGMTPKEYRGAVSPR